MIGICCQYMVPKKKRDGTIEYINFTGEKNLQLNQFNKRSYSDKKIIDTWTNNLFGLFSMIKRVYFEGFRVIRISSNLLPLWDKIPSLHNEPSIKLFLKNIGKFVKDNSIRLTQHPSQFCVLSSHSDSVISNSIEILRYHGWIFDEMGLDSNPFYSINIHGGVKGEGDKLQTTIKNLPDSCRKRLTLENDESSYSVSDLLKISNKLDIPIVCDTHHWCFNQGEMKLEESLEESIKTWKNIKPLTHLSNTDPQLINSSFKDRRKHSNYVHYIPDLQKELNNQNSIDIDFEFKMKNLAIEKAVLDFGIKK